MAAFQLFHRISDLESARVRRLIVELKREDIDFRNVDISDSARDLMIQGLGHVQVPAVLTADGKWAVGFTAIEELLRGR